MNEIKKINVDGVDYDIVAKELTKITYAELKALRDNGQLSEGHLYRITDYVTTTTQAETKSAGNVFDVIVLATSTNELSHIARAIQHEGDTYFDGNDLSAWELWYDLDNDTDKYEWADATNGKGVIYRMIDDKANDCPYDFKNILFYNTKYTYNTTEDNYYYTFSYVVPDKLYDGTVEKRVKFCYANSMGVRIYSSKRKLLFNVFHCTAFGNACSNNTFGNNCSNNTFGTNCYNNTFGTNCYNNTFGNDCSSNAFGNNCSNNAFGTNCYNNTFGNSCYYNTFGNNCSNNAFGNNCSNNTFGNSCYYNTFGDNCGHNTFRNYSDGYKVEPTKTMSEEFYDDGSGKLVPVKHPDLSTQPSILPYKFMGQYVYEQLIPLTNEEVSNLTKTGEFTVYCNTVERYISFGVEYPVFIEATITAWGWASQETDVCPLFTPVVIDFSETNSTRLEAFNVRYTQLQPYHAMQFISKAYLRVVYTSMPDEGGDYYGYNNY